MLRTLTALTALASICTVLAAAVPASAQTATSGQLSASEYTHLSNAFAGLDRALGSKTVAWGRAEAACNAIGGGTPLLRSERSSCSASVATYRVLFRFNADRATCEAKLKRTSATAAAASVNGLQLVVCLNADYQSLAHIAGALYTSAAAANKQVLARGFKGRCFSLLGESPSALTNEEDFATSAKQLAADVTVMIRINRGRAPASSLDDAQVKRDVTVFERTAKKVLTESSSGRISDCPHA